MTALVYPGKHRESDSGTILKKYPMEAAKKVSRGAIVGALKTTGYAYGVTSSLQFNVLGVATEAVDNTDGSAGDIKVEVESGKSERFGGSGFAITDVGRDVCASDDNTVTVAPGLNYVG